MTEGTTPDQTTGLSRRQYRSLFVVGLLLGMTGVAIIAVAAPTLINPYNASAGVTYGADTDGPHATVNTNLQVESGAFADNASTLNLTTSEYQLSLHSNNYTHARIIQGDGEWTNVSQLDVTNSRLTITPTDKRAISVQGDTDRLAWRDPTVGDSEADVVYSGANGETTLVVRGLPTDYQVAAVDAGTGKTLATAETGGDGVATFAGMSNSEHVVRFESTNATAVAPYYANNTTDVANESWTQGREDATLDNVTNYLTRIGTFVIGNEADGGANQMAGVLVLAVVLIGILLSQVAGRGVGPVGGTVLGLVAAGGLATAGILPAWLFAVGLLGVGLVLTAVLITALR